MEPFYNIIVFADNGLNKYYSIKPYNLRIKILFLTLYNQIKPYTMKKLFFLSLSLSCLYFTTEAQQAVPVKKDALIQATPASDPSVPTQEVNPNAADFKFESETHDFGTVNEGTQATYEFEFANTGKEPLIIQNVRASCGCTTPSYTKEPVAPGQKGKIKVVYNSSGRPGGFNKAITITSNAKTPTKVVYIKGNVEKVDEIGSPEKKPSMLQELPK